MVMSTSSDLRDRRKMHSAKTVNSNAMCVRKLLNCELRTYFYLFIFFRSVERNARRRKNRRVNFCNKFIILLFVCVGVCVCLFRLLKSAYGILNCSHIQRKSPEMCVANSSSNRRKLCSKWRIVVSEANKIEDVRDKSARPQRMV